MPGKSIFMVRVLPNFRKVAGSDLIGGDTRLSSVFLALFSTCIRFPGKTASFHIYSTYSQIIVPFDMSGLLRASLNKTEDFVTALWILMNIYHLGKRQFLTPVHANCTWTRSRQNREQTTPPAPPPRQNDPKGYIYTSHIMLGTINLFV
jgi:hypothetical protein